MGYRGEDLDLRTPQSWSAGPGSTGLASTGPGSSASGEGLGWNAADGGRGRSYGTRSPIWVDDTVLACANHAFDVALAHRASEVRIEHLLYALTRIDAAAETLEKHGVRVASLRREAATVIASEIPVGLPANGSAVPRRSEAFEDALRNASSEAGRRNAPATVDDVLSILLDLRPDLPGLGLLARHTVRPMREIPEPPLARGTGYDARYADAVESVRERVRMPAGSSYFVSETPRPARSELAATTADTIQNSRIEALEQMVRALSHDLTGERKAFAGMLQEMQRDFMAQRDDASRLGGGLYDRLQTLEHLVSGNRGGSGDGSAPQIFERIQLLEGGLDKRLAEMSRTWQALSDRMRALEDALSAGAADQGRQWSAATDKLKSLEQAVSSRGAAAVDLTPISERLDVIEEALLSPERDPGGDLAERIASIERLLQSQRAELIAETEVLKSEVGKLAGLVSSEPREAERIQRFAGVVQQGRGELIGAMTGPLLQRINSLAAMIDAKQGESASALVQLSERLAAAERALTAAVQRSEESQKAYATELGELHDALMKLNTNQHTLAGSIDQWRHHGASELSLVAKRLEGVEREAAKPVAMLEQMSASMEAMHRITVARYHRRNRLWYWLFGTDDWVAASWPSQIGKLEAERALVKPVRG